jgi:hypothetical protein
MGFSAPSLADEGLIPDGVAAIATTDATAPAEDTAPEGEGTLPAGPGANARQSAESILEGLGPDDLPPCDGEDAPPICDEIPDIPLPEPDCEEFPWTPGCPEPDPEPEPEPDPDPVPVPDPVEDLCDVDPQNPICDPVIPPLPQPDGGDDDNDNGNNGGNNNGGNGGNNAPDAGEDVRDNGPQQESDDVSGGSEVDACADPAVCGAPDVAGVSESAPTAANRAGTVLPDTGNSRGTAPLGILGAVMVFAGAVLLRPRRALHRA